MISKKGMVIGLAAALALGAASVASARVITVDGVSWDTASIFDLQVNSLNLRESTVAGQGDILHGYGQVGSINGNNSFCSGCDLSFTFQYTVSDVSGSQFGFNMGTVQFYVSPAGTFNQADPNSASVGTPWLTLSGHTGTLSTFPFNGQLLSNIQGNPSAPASGSNGQGWLDATGGPAAMYMQSHTVEDGLGGFADFSINSSFLFDGANVCANGICYPINGTANLIGKTVGVPEPGAIGVMGLGLGILGLFFWRRRKEADDRA